MIFRQVEEIKSGKKTQTRRCVKPGEKKMYFNNDKPVVYPFCDAVQKNDRVKWVVGRNYSAVPKMYQKSFGRIKVTSIWCEYLHQITNDDARAEGVASVEEYKALWESINGKTKGCRWDDNPLCWVISFTYLGDV